MPYRGKPSQGCIECRRMRKKCDIRLGGCSRCIKANRVCSGYPEQNELRICDQSSEIVLKATTIVTKGRKKSQNSLPSSTSDHSDVWNLPLLTIQDIPLYPDRDNHSLAFFFRNYIVDTGGHKSSIDIPGNEHLLASIKACGFAGISKNYPDQIISNIARSRYVRALELTNAAIRDPYQVCRDETLLAILVLLNFETLTGGVNRSLEAWEQHAHGASALLSLRGENALKHADGRWLTTHVITNITVVCLRQNLPIPPAVHAIQKLAVKYTHDPADPACILQGANLDAVDFRYAVSHGLMTSLDDIISRGYEIDVSLMCVSENPPAWWEHKVKGPRQSNEDGLPEFQLLYLTQATAYIWCCLCASRIMLQETILGSLRTAEERCHDISRYQHHRSRSLEIVRKMQSEILATTPQYMGFDCSVVELHNLMLKNRLPYAPNVAQADITTALWTGFKKPMMYQLQEVLESTLPTMRVMGGYGILWPLLSVGLASTATPTSRKYVANVLGVLGDRYRIDQALVLRKMLRMVNAKHGYDEGDE